MLKMSVGQYTVMRFFFNPILPIIYICTPITNLILVMFSVCFETMAVLFSPAPIRLMSNKLSMQLLTAPYGLIHTRPSVLMA